MQDFLLKVRSLVDQEAETWSTETLANFNQLDRMVATGADEARKRYEQAQLSSPTPSFHEFVKRADQRKRSTM